MISTLKSQIKEVEKGCGERTGILNGMWICGEEPSKNIIKLCLRCQTKLKTLKSCLALAEKDREDKIKKIDELIEDRIIGSGNRDYDYGRINGRKEMLEKLKTSLFEDGGKDND